MVKYEPLRPAMPVTVAFRQSVGGSSLVAVVKNDSGRHLAVKCFTLNPTQGVEGGKVLELPPGGTVEYGWLEGWAFHSGHRITLGHADYEDLVATAP